MFDLLRKLHLTSEHFLFDLSTYLNTISLLLLVCIPLLRLVCISLLLLVRISLLLLVCISLPCLILRLGGSQRQLEEPARSTGWWT